MRVDLQPAAHVARKRADLEGVLSLELHPHAQADRTVADCERILHSELSKNREDAQSLRLLQTIPGIGSAAAGSILVELGPDIGVFASHAHCAAWAGLCPGNNESGGRARKGNPALRRVLVECAHAASRTKDCQFHSHFRALRARKNRKQAVFATARKLTRLIHAVLKNSMPARIREPTARRSCRAGTSRAGSA